MDGGPTPKKSSDRTRGHDGLVQGPDELQCIRQLVEEG